MTRKEISNKMITSINNDPANLLYKFLRPDMVEECVDGLHTNTLLEPIYEVTDSHYQWVYGPNPRHSIGSNRVKVGDLMHAVYHATFDRYLDYYCIFDCVLCWIGVPPENAFPVATDDSDYKVSIKCNRAVVYKFMTVSEIRKTDDVLYTQLITCLLFNNMVSPRRLPVCSEFQCMMYLIGRFGDAKYDRLPEGLKTPRIERLNGVMRSFRSDVAIQEQAKIHARLWVFNLQHAPYRFYQYFYAVHFRVWMRWTPDELLDNALNQTAFW